MDKFSPTVTFLASGANQRVFTRKNIFCSRPNIDRFESNPTERINPFFELIRGHPPSSTRVQKYIPFSKGIHYKGQRRRNCEKDSM
jgi:hypothetical protein